MTTYLKCLCLLNVLFCCQCWHLFNYRPGEFVCTPLNFLCSYSEECCVGVCYLRTYLKYIKIRQCTLGNKIIGFPKEEELNYIGTKEMRKLVHDRSTEKGHVKGEIELQYDKEYGTTKPKPETKPEERINIYKQINIPLTPSPSPEPVTVCNECEKQKSMMEIPRVSKDSPMYGGPLNFTNVTMPFDNVHKIFIPPCKDCEKNSSFHDQGSNETNPSRGQVSSDKTSYNQDGSVKNPQRDQDVTESSLFDKIKLAGRNSTDTLDLKEKYNLTGDELKEFQNFADLKFLQPTIETTTIDVLLKAKGIRENLQDFIENGEEE